MNEPRRAAEGNAMDRERRAKKRRTRRIAKSIFWVAILGVAAWFFLFGNNVVSVAGIKEFFIEVFNRSGSDEVAALNGTSVESVSRLGSDMLVLSDISVTVLTKSGRESFSEHHGCSDPSVSSGGGRFIVFDRGGVHYAVYTKLGLQQEGTTEYAIIDAAICSGGSFVLVTASKSYHNEVHYFNSRGAEKYVWYSADNYIYKTAMKSNGKRFVALGMNSDGGSVKSAAFIFDPGSKGEPVKVSLDEHIFYSAAYKGSGITLVGDTVCYTLGGDGVIKSWYDYGERTLVGYAGSDDRTVLLFSVYGVGREHQLVTVDASGKEAATADVSLEFQGISATDSEITLLGSREVFVYSGGLGLKYTAEAPADGRFACAIGKTVFVFGVGSITKIAA